MQNNGKKSYSDTTQNLTMTIKPFLTLFKQQIAKILKQKTLMIEIVLIYQAKQRHSTKVCWPSVKLLLHSIH